MNKLFETAQSIRAEALKMIHAAGSGHPGGSLSCADLLAALYFDELRVRPDRPDWPERDRFVLSKGHAAPAYYAALGLRGYFPREQFSSFRRLGGLLQGHPEVTTPGVDAPSGSLGMGLSQGLGMAHAARVCGRPTRVYVLLGDGDMEEGNTWEALMAAPHQGITRLVALLDANGLQGDGPVEAQMDYGPAPEKLAAFGWRVQEIDGHDLGEILDALAAAREAGDAPTFVVARTVKGKGVSFMEHDNGWHGSRGLTPGELETALEELEGSAR